MVPDSELQAYFDAIASDPESDAPRLTLAAFLAQRGDQRGESIRLACEVEHLEPDDPRRAEIAARIQELPRFTYFGPTPQWHAGYEWARGFINGVNWSVATFEALGERLMRATPARSLDVLFGIRGQGARLAACPAFVRLHRLCAYPADSSDVLAIAQAPQLRVLMFDHVKISPDMIAAFAKGLPALKELRLGRSTVDGDAWEPLAKFATRLDWLGLDVSAAPKALRPAFDRFLPKPPAQPDVVRFGRLDLRTCDWRKWLETGAHPEVKELKLREVGDDGEAIGAAFPALEVLDVGHGLCPRYPDGVADGVIEQLARALPTLKRIVSHKEWHVYNDSEAREGSELRTLGGVELLVHHSIWP